MPENTLPAARPPDGALALGSMSDLLQLADVLAKSGFFADARGAAQCCVKVLAGRELGFPTIASMVGIHIIEGKPSIGAHLLASLVKRSGRYDYRVLRCDREACELEWLERRGDKWESVGRTSMSAREAWDCGLSAAKDGKSLKANWQRSGDDMLFARCVSKGYRRYCPDLTGGTLVYTQEEMEPADTPAPPPPAAHAPDPGTDFSARCPEPASLDDALPHAAPAEVTSGGSAPNAQAPAATEAPPGTIGEGPDYQALVELIRARKRSAMDVRALCAATGVKTLSHLRPDQLPRARALAEQGQATPRDADRAMELATRLFVSPTKLMDRLQAVYGVNSLSHLTLPQLAEVEGKLRDALKSPSPPAAGAGDSSNSPPPALT